MYYCTFQRREGRRKMGDRSKLPSLYQTLEIQEPTRPTTRTKSAQRGASCYNVAIAIADKSYDTRTEEVVCK